MNPIRVLLADDHTLVRVGIRGLLEKMAGIQVVAETGDGREALRLIEARRPDVVLMDITMPGLNGLEAAARVAKDFPNVRVIMLSVHANEEYVWQALRGGAAGYLVKAASPTELELAVTAVARGEMYLSPGVSKRVVQDYIRRVAGEAGTLDLLTPRQREILQMIAEGHTTKEVAARLNVSVKTVETHRAQLMERLDIHGVAGLVRYAIRVGLVSPDK
jgi:DNA-binding NarL/FixJ family response regulator